MSSIRYVRPRPRSSPTATMFGFTLVELMVAVTIGLIILGAVAQIFATSSATYNVQEDLARAQESGRFAVDFLKRDLRMAGYAGCVNVTQAQNPDAAFTVNNRLNGTNFATNFGGQQHIAGFDYVSGTTWSPLLPANVFAAGEVRPETDVVAIRLGDTRGFRLENDMANPTAALDIQDFNGLEQDDIVMLTDCNGIDIFQVSNVITPGNNDNIAHAASGIPGNTDANLSQAYTDDAQLMKLWTRLYYIGTGSNGGPALFRKDLVKGNEGPGVAGQELVEGVESMHIVYGEDTTLDGSADIYRLPANITDISRVASVRISLLVRTLTERGAESDQQTYDLLGDTTNTSDDYDPTDDRRLRRMFTSTVQLRNQRTD